MRKSAVISILVVAILSRSGAQQSEQSPDMNPRDVFWSASDLVSVHPNPATKPGPPSSTKSIEQHPKPVSSTSTTKSAKPQRTQIDPAAVSENGYGARPHIVRLSTEPLGLRYTLLKKSSDARYLEVSPGTTFHSGDRVRLSIMANQPGHLYIIQQGSSGSWSAIFPTPEARRDSNQIEAGRVYQVPDDMAFEFNDQPGQEKLFILLSREPISDLDGVIFGLRQQNRNAPASPVPATTEEASNRISDALIQQLNSRDLTPVKEEVNDQQSDEDHPGEKAFYVVNKMSATATSASRIVANLVLDHK
jgi:hypothetical protein